MSEEEKKAVERVEKELENEKNAHWDYQWLTGWYGNSEIEILLNLIKKQQKEIEQLDKKFQYAVPVDVINDLYISKDKIRKRIKEVEEQLKSIEIVKFHKDIKERLVILKYEIQNLLNE